MRRYVKKPAVIEAMHFDGDHARAMDIVEWGAGQIGFECQGAPEKPCRSHKLEIHTLEGTMLAAPGDYVIRGVAGEFYPCKPEIFHETYEATYAED